MAQISATALLVRLLSLRSFAVGNMLIKTDIVMTALLGAAFFSERLSGLGFAALIVILAGVVLLVLGGPEGGTAECARRVDDGVAVGGRVAFVRLRWGSTRSPISSFARRRWRCQTAAT